MKTENNIFISYIVPCFNVQHYVPRCLDSLSIQFIDSENGIEFVFVNDGSTDDTLKILEQFAVNDDRAILINQKNQGVSAARNVGLKTAKGKYVFFLDGDDYLTDNASQIIFDACNRRDVDVVITNAYGVREGQWNKKSNWNTCPGLRPDIYSVKQFVNSVRVLPISFKAYRRKFLFQNNIFYDEDLKVGEVLCFFIHSLVYARNIVFSEDRVMNYLHRNGSVMREYNIGRDENVFLTMHRINEYAHLFEFDIMREKSYLFALYNIVNYFSIMKYLRTPVYNNTVKEFIDKVLNDKIYRITMKEILSQSFSFSRHSLNIALLYYLPTNCSFRILRLKAKVGSCLKKLLNYGK